MSTQNIGGQKLFYKFRFDLNADILTSRVTYTVEPAIYQGVWLNVNSPTSILINTGTDNKNIIEIADGEYSIRIEFTLNIVLEVPALNPEDTPFVCIRWTYKESETDIYADFLFLDKASILENDIVIGEIIFVSGNVNSFSYLDRSTPAQNTSITIRDALKVFPTDPASNTVFVNPGKFVTSKQVWDFVGGISPSSTTPISNDRYDLLYIDSQMVIKWVEGNEAPTPTIPEFLNKLVLAIVYRKVGQSEIYSNNITNIPLTRISLEQFSLTTTGEGASMIGIEDSGDYYTGENVEAVTQEIANKMETEGALWAHVQDTGGYYDSDNVEDVLDEIGGSIVGQVATFILKNVVGWLYCDGSIISKFTDPKYTNLVNLLKTEANGDVTHPYYDADTNQAKLPDLRGRSTRGIDTDSTGRDKDGLRKSGSYQADNVIPHNHTATSANEVATHVHDDSHSYIITSSTQSLPHYHSNNHIHPSQDTGSDTPEHVHTFTDPHFHSIQFHNAGLSFPAKPLKGSFLSGTAQNINTTAVYPGEFTGTPFNIHKHNVPTYNYTGNTGNNVGNHTHTVTVNYSGDTGIQIGNHNHVITVNNTGDVENTVKNVALYYLIKY